MNIHKKSMSEQREILNQEIENWMNFYQDEKKSFNQIDDILVLGMKL